MSTGVGYLSTLMLHSLILKLMDMYSTWWVLLSSNLAFFLCLNCIWNRSSSLLLFAVIYGGLPPLLFLPLSGCLSGTISPATVLVSFGSRFDPHSPFQFRVICVSEYSISSPSRICLSKLNLHTLETLNVYFGGVSFSEWLFSQCSTGALSSFSFWIACTCSLVLSHMVLWVSSWYLAMVPLVKQSEHWIT